jgi:hypothetical protein
MNSFYDYVFSTIFQSFTIFVCVHKKYFPKASQENFFLNPMFLLHKNIFFYVKRHNFSFHLSEGKLLKNECY